MASRIQKSFEITKSIQLKP